MNQYRAFPCVLCRRGLPTSGYSHDWARAYMLGRTVRVELLQKGDRFRAITGGTYTYDHQDGGPTGGAHWVVQDGGLRTCFAGCADVEPLGRAAP